MQAKALWKPVTKNIILVAGTSAKARDYEEQIVANVLFGQTRRCRRHDRDRHRPADNSRPQAHSAAETRRTPVHSIRDTPDKTSQSPKKSSNELDKRKTRSRIQSRCSRHAAIAVRSGHPSRTAVPRAISFVIPDSSSSLQRQQLPLNKLLSGGDTT